MERQRRKQELENMRKLIEDEQRQLENVPPIPAVIPVGPQDINPPQPTGVLDKMFGRGPQQPQYPAPQQLPQQYQQSYQQPRMQYPQPQMQPQYPGYPGWPPMQMPQQQMPDPNEMIPRIAGAVEVAKEKDHQRTLGMVGILSAFIPVLIGVYSIGYGLASVTVFAAYWMFEVWRAVRRRGYFRQFYGI